MARSNESFDTSRQEAIAKAVAEAFGPQRNVISMVSLVEQGSMQKDTTVSVRTEEQSVQVHDKEQVAEASTLVDERSEFIDQMGVDLLVSYRERAGILDRLSKSQLAKAKAKAKTDDDKIIDSNSSSPRSWWKTITYVAGASLIGSFVLVSTCRDPRPTTAPTEIFRDNEGKVVAPGPLYDFLQRNR